MVEVAEGGEEEEGEAEAAVVAEVATRSGHEAANPLVAEAAERASREDIITLVIIYPLSTRITSYYKSSLGASATSSYPPK